MSRKHLALLAAAALPFAGCSKPPAPEPEPAPEPVGAAEPADGGPSLPVIAASGPQGAYVTAAAHLRREASEAPRVASGRKGKGTQPNVLATLQRGEKVTVLEEKDEWARVRASDESEGWVKRTSLVAAEGVAEATVLLEADSFDRPDLLAVNVRRKVAPGTLLLVLKQRELFSEVNLGSGSPSAWVLTERLAAGPKDVMAAKLLEKARAAERAGRHDEALAVLDLARRQVAESPLVEILAGELGTAAAQVVVGGEPGAAEPAGAVPAVTAKNDEERRPAPPAEPHN